MAGPPHDEPGPAVVPFQALDPRSELHASTLAESDQRLLVGIARGSAEALGSLYDRYASFVFGLARRLLVQTDDAEEVVQDVFSQVWREAGRYRADRGTVACWLLVLTRTRAIDRLRARNARPDVTRSTEPGSISQLLSSASDPEQATLAEEVASAVRRALQQLPEPQRVALQLAYYEGLTQAEIAERLSVPLGTIKSRIRTAMSALTAVLSS